MGIDLLVSIILLTIILLYFFEIGCEAAGEDGVILPALFYLLDVLLY